MTDAANLGASLQRKATSWLTLHLLNESASCSLSWPER